MAAGALAKAQFRAMGTTIEVHAPTPAIAASAARVERLFRDWDAALSRFRDDSELAALNRAAGRAFAASSLLFSVVHAALWWARETGGTFDPTLLQQMEQLGYHRTFADVAAAQPLAPLAGVLNPGGAWRAIVLEPERRTIRMPQGCGLDLGGIAKGMAVDAALQALQAADIETAMINAGGDLAVAGLPPGSDAWPVEVADLPGEVVPLQRGAMATSGTSRRRWMQGDRLRHHLLDPATGYPAESGLRTVTVVAGSCAAADVAATTAFLRGPDAGTAFLRQQGFAGLLIPAEGTPIRIEPWPAQAR
jgi:thiamine biosynthesis lipoprotein